MKLSNIESRKLLPRFASKIAWLMDALDSIIKPISERVKSIDAPLTLEAIAALTDEELEALYEQYGVAQYYPELSRSTRDLMLYEMCKIYRYLGTPHAIELLCNYIFDNVPLNVHVIDNLAFDEHGTLIDASLLDVFDIEVNPDLPVLSVDATARLLANIIRFSRNSQALRDIIYTFSEDFDLSVYPLNAGIPAQNWDNDALCEPVTPPTPAYTEITLYYSNNYKGYQTGVTSGFTGNVSSGYCYQLYVDDRHTIPWTGYDYTNYYESGYYDDGEWVPLPSKIEDMPSTTSEARKNGFIMMDTGCMWLCTNSSSSTTYNTATCMTIRVYPKSQQHYPLYFSQNSNTYNNYSTSGGMVYAMKHRPGNTAYSWMPWSDSFPTRTIVKALYSSGKSNIAIDQLSWNGTNNISIKLASGYSPSFRTVIFTLDVPTYTSWANLSGNKSAEANEVCPLLDKNGEYVVYDATVSYTIIGLFNYSGGHPFSSPSRVMLDAQLGAFDVGNPTRLCFKLNRAVTFSYVWYIKTPTS